MQAVRSPCVPASSARGRATTVTVHASAKAALKVIVKRPTEEELKTKGVRSWPTWGCGVSKFPWAYQESETCFILEGQVVVTPTGGEGVEIKAGDMATFPAGMSCTWDVKAPINKHYQFF